MYDQLILNMQQAAAAVMKWPRRTVNIFHHNDADGLSSGAILMCAFEREGFEVHRFALEKPYPAVLKKVYEQGGLKKTPHLQWFHAANRLAPMGVKMIGVLCYEIRNMGFIDPQKYIAGFQVIPNGIPGFGPIAFDEVKISMRVPADLELLIKDEKAPPLNTFLPEATNRLGGFSDACHRLAAATTVSMGKEGALINEMEKILNK